MKYIGIKFVDASPMTTNVAKDKGYRVNDSTGDGYEVTYEDGYRSWCPKNVFEKHNFEIKNKVLADSCALMVSPDYKERFRAEYIQIRNRYYGLVHMLHDWDKGRLKFEPASPRKLYAQQREAMWSYLRALETRAHIESIDLPSLDDGAAASNGAKKTEYASGQ